MKGVESLKREIAIVSKAVLPKVDYAKEAEETNKLLVEIEETEAKIAATMTEADYQELKRENELLEAQPYDPAHPDYDRACRHAAILDMMSIYAQRKREESQTE